MGAYCIFVCRQCKKATGPNTTPLLDRYGSSITEDLRVSDKEDAAFVSEHQGHEGATVESCAHGQFGWYDFDFENDSFRTPEW